MSCSVKVLGCTDDPGAWVVWAARISHRSKGSPEDDARLLGKLREWGHLSPFEFARWTVWIEVDEVTRPSFEDLVFHAPGLVCSRGLESTYVLTGTFRHLLEVENPWIGRIEDALDRCPFPWSGGSGWLRRWVEGEAPLPGTGKAAEAPYLYLPDLEGVLSGKEARRHAFLTWLFEDVSRSFSHQLVRRRLFSYMQESLRRVGPKGYITPESFGKLAPYAEGVMVEAFDVYDELVRMGVPREDARFVLPIGTRTRIAACGSLEYWERMIEARTHPSAQWEIRGKAEEVREWLRKKGFAELMELVDRYREAARETYEAARALGEYLVERISEVVPDIEFSVGWAEAGVDTICLYSEKSKNSLRGDRFHLSVLLNDLLGLDVDSLVDIDSPFGVYVSADEFRRIGELLGAPPERVEAVLKQWEGDDV